MRKSALGGSGGCLAAGGDVQDNDFATPLRWLFCESVAYAMGTPRPVLVSPAEPHAYAVPSPHRDVRHLLVSAYPSPAERAKAHKAMLAELGVATM